MVRRSPRLSPVGYWRNLVGWLRSPSPRWRAWRYDEWLVRWKSSFAGAFSIGIIVLLALLIRVVVVGPYLGLTTSELIDGLLAGGTLALAYAALVQAVSGEIKRKGDLAPNLEIQILGLKPGTSDMVVFGTNIITPSPDDGKLWARVRNLGPGSATHVSFIAGNRWYPLLTGTGQVPLKVPTNYGSNGEAVVDGDPLVWIFMDGRFSIRANEWFDFEFATWTHTLPQGSPPVETFHAARQVVFQAEGTDVEGRHVVAERLGIVLFSLSTTPKMLGSTKAGDPHPSTWIRLPEKELRKVPLVRTPPET
jgi:hypothetical protein